MIFMLRNILLKLVFTEIMNLGIIFAHSSLLEFFVFNNLYLVSFINSIYYIIIFYLITFLKCFLAFPCKNTITWVFHFFIIFRKNINLIKYITIFAENKCLFARKWQNLRKTSEKTKYSTTKWKFILKYKKIKMKINQIKRKKVKLQFYDLFSYYTTDFLKDIFKTLF